MRLAHQLIFTTFIFSALSLNAAFEDSISTEELIKPEDVSRQDPFTIQAYYDYIGYSKMEKKEFDCTKIRYNQLNVAGRMVFYYNPRCQEGAMIRGGYTRDQIYWFDNPYFDQVNFNTADLSLIFFSHRLCNWLWTGQVSAGYDTDRNSLGKATAWDFLLWGRYSRSDCFGVHVGFLAQTGMRIDHVYPILGFDLKLRGPWRLSVVYPVNISLFYDIDCNWSAGIAARFFNSRHRLSGADLTPDGLVTYKATGAEFRMNYQLANRVTANIHAGGTFGGQLKVANSEYRNKKHFDFKPAGYVGGEFEFSF